MVAPAGKLQGSLVAIVTPMRENGPLDLDALRALIDWHIAEGTDGIVVVGTTGESPTVDFEEHRQVIDFAVKHAAKRIPIIAGTGGNSTVEAIELTESAKKNGATACLSVVPYYNKPPQEGLYEHFRTVAQATALPVIVYNIPGRTAVRISNETLLRLAEIENVVGVKDATADLVAASELAAAAPGFEVISGEDALTFPLVCLGATGVISVTSHVAGDRMRRMIDLAREGDLSGARAIHQELLPLYSILFMTTSPIPVKAAMGLLGQPAGPPRLPLVPATEDQLGRLKAALQEAGTL
jgi:4-hydroxy-tetrahydrodipicolinate synthase